MKTMSGKPESDLLKIFLAGVSSNVSGFIFMPDCSILARTSVISSDSRSVGKSCRFIVQFLKCCAKGF